MDPTLLLAAAGGGLTYQLIQIGGSLLILAGFAGAQVGRLSPQSRSYIVLNLVGSVILAVLAAIGEQWGFLLLEGVWAIVSAWAFTRLLRGRAVQVG